MVRAKLDHVYNGDQDKICAILIHGDAAVAGQGARILHHRHELAHVRFLHRADRRRHADGQGGL